MPPSYEIIDHTADIGIRVKGSSLEELFIFAAEAMYDLIAQPKRPLIPAITYPVMVEADTVDQLLVKWLQDLHMAYDMRRLVLTHFWVEQITPTSVMGGGKGQKFDDSRHRAGTQIKAVTHHHLRVEQTDDTWIAEVIFDI